MTTIRNAARAAMAIAALASARVTHAQDGPSFVLDAGARRQVIDSIDVFLAAEYVAPAVAREIRDDLAARLASGSYDSVTDPALFASTLTAQLRAVSHDAHLRVRFSAAALPAMGLNIDPPPSVTARQRVTSRAVNYGFEHAERLIGNVGYLEIRLFNYEGDEMRRALASAMSFLANTDALIIDLRRNTGGHRAMVEDVASYFFADSSVLLNSVYWRFADTTEQSYTRRVDPASRYGVTRPVYILTSRTTFSAAETFAYSLQALKRAVIVGDTTGGGANSGGERRINEHFALWVPRGRVFSPVTNSNWEGVGVIPDVPTRAEDAQGVAHLAALEWLMAHATTAQGKQDVQRALDAVRPGARQP